MSVSLPGGGSTSSVCASHEGARWVQSRNNAPCAANVILLKPQTFISNVGIYESRRVWVHQHIFKSLIWWREAEFWSSSLWRDYWLFKSPMFAFTGQFVMAASAQYICNRINQTQSFSKIYFSPRIEPNWSLSSVNGLVTLNVSFNEYWECDSVNALWRARSSQWDSFTRDWSGSERPPMFMVPCTKV